jgi:hypothetical protein
MLRLLQTPESELTEEQKAELTRIRALSQPQMSDITPQGCLTEGDADGAASPGSDASGGTRSVRASLLSLNPNYVTTDPLTVALEDTMVISMKGIAAGMQNTG